MRTNIRTKLALALTACALLCNCAFGAAATAVAVAPALEGKVPKSPRAPAYKARVSGVSFTVNHWLRRACAAKPPALETRQGTWQCAQILFPPQSGLSVEDGLRIAKTVIARNKHMNATGVSDSALLAGNRRYMATNAPGIGNTFSFPYYSRATKQVVFAQ